MKFKDLVQEDKSNKKYIGNIVINAKEITSLEGIPQEIDGSFYVRIIT